MRQTPLPALLPGRPGGPIAPEGFRLCDDCKLLVKGVHASLGECTASARMLACELRGKVEALELELQRTRKDLRVNRLLVFQSSREIARLKESIRR